MATNCRYFTVSLPCLGFSYNIGKWGLLHYLPELSIYRTTFTQSFVRRFVTSENEVLMNLICAVEITISERVGAVHKDPGALRNI